MGDGRHRQDPKGHGRYLIAGLGILLVLALLATGGYALYSVLTTQPQPGQASAVTEPSRAAHAAAKHASAVRQRVPTPAGTEQFAGPPTFALTVTGARSYVSVRLPNGHTLLNTTLGKGETARFHHPKLEITIGDPAAVRIAVNGRVRTSDQQGITTFSVSRE